MSTIVLPATTLPPSVAQGRGRRNVSRNSNYQNSPSTPQNQQQNGGLSAGSAVPTPTVLSGQPGPPSCLTSGLVSGVTGGGSLGCLTSTGNSSSGHGLAGYQATPLPPSPPNVVNLNSYHKQYSITDPNNLPLLQPLDRNLRQRYDDIILAHPSSDPSTSVHALLRAYGLHTFQ